MASPPLRYRARIDSPPYQASCTSRHDQEGKQADCEFALFLNRFYRITQAQGCNFEQTASAEGKKAAERQLEELRQEIQAKEEAAKEAAPVAADAAPSPAEGAPPSQVTA